MYPSKGGNAYGQQSYAAQQAYGQISGAGYPGNQVGPDGGSQHGVAPQSMMGAGQEADMGRHRSYASQVPQYVGQYAAVYGSAAMSGSQQVGGDMGKGAVSSTFQGQTGYPPVLAEPSKFLSGTLSSSLGMNNDDYLSASNRGYSQKGDQLSALKNSDYAPMSSREYGVQQGAYIGRELQGDSARRYSESVALSHQHQSDMHDHMAQASLLRQQQLLKAQSLQSGSDMRQADYLAARAAPIHSGSQELSSYSGRMDADPHSFPPFGGTSFGGQHAASILGGAPRSNVDDLIYAQGSSVTRYGVALPPGRDYVSGKGLHGPSLESDYQGSSRGHPSLGVSMISERKDDRSAFHRELEIRDDERRREHMREREKERERDGRERERERERERDRLGERRDRERERDRKRELDSRRERTPRATKDRRDSSSTRDEKPLRRVTTRREAAHRHHSPVKEKKREYICKVSPFCLVDIERDYLSLNKRYPRLPISPDFSKVVFNWPKEKLNLSLHTPVSFEHGFVEFDNKPEEKALIPVVDELSESKCGRTVWNAKVILMSGISNDALEELSSEKSSDERIIHFNKIMKFAILRKDHFFMAIGGPWDVTIDGDPSVNDSPLIQTALRYLKDLTQIDLQNCLHWNRFLEIHYDRVGKDGLFSHKEITVFFLPDLSGCLPSLDLWRTQWLAHMMDVAERKRELASKQKKSSEKKEAVQGEKSYDKTEKDDTSAMKVKVEADAVKDEKVDKMDVEGPSIEKKSEANNADRTKDDISETKHDVSDQKGNVPILNEKECEKNAVGAMGSGYKDDKKDINVGATDRTVDIKIPPKKKIVKKKVIGKKAAAEDTIAKPDKKMDIKDEGDTQVKQEPSVQEDENSANPVSVETFIRKEIVKKLPAGKPAQKEDKVVDASDVQTGKKPDKENEHEVDAEKEKKETDGTAAAEQVTGVKPTPKKKVIRKVIKRKVSGSAEKNTVASIKKVAEKDDTAALPDASTGEDLGHVEKKDKDINVVSNLVNKSIEDPKMLASEKESTSENKMNGKKDKKESKSDDNTSIEEKRGSKTSTDLEDGRKEDSRRESHDAKDRLKDDNQKKAKDSSSDFKHKSHKEVKDKGIREEPPRHPGLFLHTKQPKDSKVRIRSISLSLDDLLDYSDKDIGESTFELSLFAESLNEMLQYEMGCRVLSFLEKLQRRFVMQRNLRKRQREENPEMEGQKGNKLAKHSKNNVDSPVENESIKSGIKDTSSTKHNEKMGEDGPATEPDTSKMENKTEEDDIEDEEEDPEEIMEDEDQKMDDAAPSENGVEQDESAVKTGLAEPDKSGGIEDDTNKSVSERGSDKTAKTDDKSETVKKDKMSGTEKPDSVKEVVNKELLQAFRFFDQNQVGYIRAEDLRCLLHNLGKFLSHRHVKEMIQSALFESNSDRDNRIFYKKLVSLKDI